jgi:hypothetical protein
LKNSELPVENRHFLLKLAHFRIARALGSFSLDNVEKCQTDEKNVKNRSDSLKNRIFAPRVRALTAISVVNRQIISLFGALARSR